MSAQREMALLGDVKRRQKLAPPELIKACHSRRDALRLLVALSGLKHRYLAASLDMSPAQFSKILSGQAHLDEDLRDTLQDACGYDVLEQFGAYRRGYDLVERAKDERIAELEAELHRLRATA